MGAKLNLPPKYVVCAVCSISNLEGMKHSRFKPCEIQGFGAVYLKTSLSVRAAGCDFNFLSLDTDVVIGNLPRGRTLRVWLIPEGCSL